MISPVRATGVLAIGTVGALLGAIVTSKALALIAGPEGVGLYGLLQSLLGLASIVFGLGLGTAMVRATARAVADQDADRWTALLVGGRLLAVGGGLVGALLMIGFRDQLAAVFLGSSDLGWAVVMLAPTLLIQLVTAVELGYINGHHRVHAISVLTAGSSLLTAVVIVPLVARFGLPALPAALLLASVLSLTAAWLASRRSVSGAVGKANQPRVSESVRWLLRFGGGYTLSQLVGTGVQLIVPVLVLWLLDADAVGNVRAASAVGIGYLGVILATIARDYYPRVAAAGESEPVLRRLVSDQIRLLVVLSAPLILTASAFAPVVMTVLYSDAFNTAAIVLQWMLVGDVLKLISWTGSYVILARGSPATYFRMELLGGVALLLSTAIAVKLLGVVGVGVGYTLTYAVYLLVVWRVARPIVRLPITNEVRAGIGLSMALATLILARAVTPTALVLAVLLLGAVGASLYAVRTVRSSGLQSESDTTS